MAGNAAPPEPTVQPATPPTPTPTPAVPPPGAPAAGATPKGVLTPESDPNLEMSKLVSRSRARKAADAAGGPAPAPAPSPTPAPAPAAPEPDPNGEGKAPLVDLIGNALRFRKKPDAAAPAPAPAAPAAAAPPDPEPAPAPAAKPTTVKARKAAPAPIDAGKLVREATSAAVEAALKVTQPRQPEVNPALDALSDEDREDYEIAQHMARINPKYADAPKQLLDQMQRATQYAANWEAANPGKTYDPEDEEHNEFFATVRHPWTAAEFRKAEVDMLSDRKMAEFKKQNESQLADINRSAGRAELAPKVNQAFTNAGAQLAKLVGDDVFKAVTTGGIDALDQQDPIMAKALAGALGDLHPFVEAVVQIDDPHQRFAIDRKNPAHAQWCKVVETGEAQCAGQVLKDGRVFATRADFVKMSEAKQSRHWYLTSDMILQGVLEYAAEEVKRGVAEHKKLIEGMGYVRKEPGAGAGGGAPATPNAGGGAAPAAAPATVKPVSPTATSGPKIDASGDAPKTGDAALMGQLSNILFRT